MNEQTCALHFVRILYIARNRHHREHAPVRVVFTTCHVAFIALYIAAVVVAFRAHQ